MNGFAGELQDWMQKAVPEQESQVNLGCSEGVLITLSLWPSSIS